MTDAHFDTALHAFTTALSDRLRPGVATFADLFTEDGVIEVPFDGDGTAAPLKGRAAIAGMVEALRGVLRFEQVEFTHMYDAGAATVICEYQARLHRADLGASFRRRYISVITLRDGRPKLIGAIHDQVHRHARAQSRPHRRGVRQPPQDRARETVHVPAGVAPARPPLRPVPRSRRGAPGHAPVPLRRHHRDLVRRHRRVRSTPKRHCQATTGHGDVPPGSTNPDGSLRRWTPIWVVSVGEQVYVRTWRRRESGWFGHVLDSHRAHIRVPGLEADVTVEDAGVGLAELRADIDAAYRTKYGRYGRTSVEAMVSAAAAAATLRLSPEPAPDPSGSAEGLT